MVIGRMGGIEISVIVLGRDNLSLSDYSQNITSFRNGSLVEVSSLLHLMSLQLSIPDSVLSAIRLPESRIEQELLQELAIALYTQELLSFGKARELAQIDKYEFGQLLGQRGVTRHYGLQELEDDLSYGSGE